MAAAGPFAAAAAQFILTFALLHTLPVAAFGAFSFLLVAVPFSWGLSSALVCAPLPLAYHAQEPTRSRNVAALFAVNAIGSFACAGIFVLIALPLTGNLLCAVLFGGYAGLALARWFARSDAYARGTPFRTAASDVVQALIVVTGAALVWAHQTHALLIAIGALFAGSLGGLAPFGRPFWRQQIAGFSFKALAFYRGPWRDHSRWALLGVITTEATANAHAYFVTLMLGPKYFAPIAASALIIRPITVAMNALSEFERARMARDHAMGNVEDIRQALRFFRGVLALVWVGSVAGTVVILTFVPRIMVPHQQPFGAIVLGASLWLLVVAVRAARTPDSVLLQAAGAFQPLAYASVFSAVASVLLVALLIMLAGPMWSIVGILAGEIVFAIAIFVQKHRWAALQPQKRESPWRS